MAALKPNLFAYGTLELPEMMQQVTRAYYSSQAARLYGYARYMVKGKPYPGLIAQAGAITEGVLYRHVTPRSWQRLDTYEDRFYERITVDVVTDANEVVAAEVYVIPNNMAHLLSSKTWDRQQFAKQYLSAYRRRFAILERVS